jgi:hypothetical protein
VRNDAHPARASELHKVLANPRYTGRQVWIWSEAFAHPPIIDEATFHLVAQVLAALANKISHPWNVTLRQDVLLGPLDEWLAGKFGPRYLPAIINELAAAAAIREPSATPAGDSAHASGPPVRAKALVPSAFHAEDGQRPRGLRPAAVCRIRSGGRPSAEDGPADLGPPCVLVGGVLTADHVILPDRAVHPQRVACHVGGQRPVGPVDVGERTGMHDDRKLGGRHHDRFDPA